MVHPHGQKSFVLPTQMPLRQMCSLTKFLFCPNPKYLRQNALNVNRACARINYNLQNIQIYLMHVLHFAKSNTFLCLCISLLRRHFYVVPCNYIYIFNCNFGKLKSEKKVWYPTSSNNLKLSILK